jgi:TolA-binding protein
MKRVLALLCSLAILSGCSQTYQAEREYWKAEKMLTGVTKAMVKEQGPQVFDPVIASFKRVYEQFPGTAKAAESLFVISNLYLRQKKYDEAIRTLEKIIQNYSEFRDRAPEARYGIAGIYEATGEWEKAEKLFWETSEYSPYHQKGLYAPVHIILHYKKAKDKEGMTLAYQKAVDFYNRMLKQTGPIQAASSLKNYLALAQLANGSWREARATWDSLPKEFPDSNFAPLALLASGELSWKKEELEAAAASYEEYLQKYPKHPLVPRTMVQLGMIYSTQKNYPKSREWFEKAITNEKKADTIADVKLMIGKSYQDEGLWTDAEKIYQEIDANYKDTNAALQIPFMLASYYEEQGKADEAKKILDEAIGRYQSLVDSADPRMADMALRLQNAAYAEKGDWQSILSNFEERIQQEKTPERKANWVFLKAVVTEKRLQDNAAALALYQDFVAQFPDHPLASLAKSRQELLLKKA